MIFLPPEMFSHVCMYSNFCVIDMLSGAGKEQFSKDKLVILNLFRDLEHKTKIISISLFVNHVLLFLGVINLNQLLNAFPLYLYL
jgi:hypothetical protein